MTEAGPEEQDANRGEAPPRAVEAATDATPDEVVVGPLSVWIARHRTVFLATLLLLLVGADQTTKAWAQSSLAELREVTKHKNIDGKLQRVREKAFVHTETVQVIPGALSFIYRENPAAAFSLTRSIPAKLRRPFLLAVSSLAMVFIAVWFFRIRRPDGLLMTAFAFILAGALGNLIDRARFGYVVDFINMYAGFINPRWPPWPTYNIADMCIVGGALSVIYRTLRPLYPEEEGAPPGGSDADMDPATSAT